MTRPPSSAPDAPFSGATLWRGTQFIVFRSSDDAVISLTFLSLALSSPNSDQLAGYSRDDHAESRQANSSDEGAAGEPAREGEIVVTASRRAEPALPIETVLDEARIRSYGSDSIGELLDRIAALLRAGQEGPEILINGMRISSAEDIKAYPPEALQKLEILAPGAAERRGLPPGKRVVNLELKQTFASTDIDAGTTFPTAGGRRSDRLSAGRFVIDGDNRWTAQLQFSRDSRLLESERTIPAGQEEADVPIGAREAQPDPQVFRSLLPSARSASFNAGLTRPLGEFSASLGLHGGLSRSEHLTGAVFVTLPSLGSAGPFEATGTTQPPRALRNATWSHNLGASASLSGSLQGWATTLGAAFSSGVVKSLDERASAKGGATAAEPPLPTTWIAEHTRTRTTAASLSLSASKGVARLPAGEVTASLSFNANRNWVSFSSDAMHGGANGRHTTQSDRLHGQTTISAPILSGSSGGTTDLGDLAADLTAEVVSETASEPQYKLTAGLRWSPVPLLDLRGSFSHHMVEPTFDQRYAPQTTVITATYDFVREETVQAPWVFGGNAELNGGSTRAISLNAMIRPLGTQLLTLSVDYSNHVSRNGILSFPTITPDVENAFPERILRDGEGRITEIDARPINIDRSVSERVTSGVVVQWSAGGGAANPCDTERSACRIWHYDVSLNHTWQLKNRTVVATEIAAIDHLAGGGMPRHSLSLRAGAGTQGLGVSVEGQWTGPARVDRQSGADRAQDFVYPASMLIHVGVFVEPGQFGSGHADSGWLSDAKVSLDVRNVLGGYRRMMFAGGGIPAGASRDEIDPLGRTIQLSLRKRF